MSRRNAFDELKETHWYPLKTGGGRLKEGNMEPETVLQKMDRIASPHMSEEKVTGEGIYLVAVRKKK